MTANGRQSKNKLQLDRSTSKPRDLPRFFRVQEVRINYLLPNWCCCSAWQIWQICAMLKVARLSTSNCVLLTDEHYNRSVSRIHSAYISLPWLLSLPVEMKLQLLQHLCTLIQQKTFLDATVRFAVTLVVFPPVAPLPSFKKMYPNPLSKQASFLLTSLLLD